MVCKIIRLSGILKTLHGFFRLRSEKGLADSEKTDPKVVDKAG
jgi:hypothetical protein